MECSRPRRHSVGAPGRRGAGSLHQSSAITNSRVESAAPSSELSGSSRSSSSAKLRSGPSSLASSSSSKRRRSSTGRRRLRKGAHSGDDFSFSPYQPMVIQPTSSSLSPHPRRASEPPPPRADLQLRREREAAAGRQPETEKSGPTLDQCLVLPSGVALKVDGLLPTPVPESRDERHSDDEGTVGVGERWGEGEREGDVDRGQAVKESSGGDPGEKRKTIHSPAQGAAESRPGAGAGAGVGVGVGEIIRDDRAIISSYHFSPPSSQAAITAEEPKASKQEWPGIARGMPAAMGDTVVAESSPERPEKTGVSNDARAGALERGASESGEISDVEGRPSVEGSETPTHESPPVRQSLSSEGAEASAACNRETAVAATVTDVTHFHEGAVDGVSSSDGVETAMDVVTVSDRTTAGAAAAGGGASSAMIDGSSVVEEGQALAEGMCAPEEASPVEGSSSAAGAVDDETSEPPESDPSSLNLEAEAAEVTRQDMPKEADGQEGLTPVLLGDGRAVGRDVRENSRESTDGGETTGGVAASHDGASPREVVVEVDREVGGKEVNSSCIGAPVEEYDETGASFALAGGEETSRPKDEPCVEVVPASSDSVSGEPGRGDADYTSVPLERGETSTVDGDGLVAAGGIVAESESMGEEDAHAKEGEAARGQPSVDVAVGSTVGDGDMDVDAAAAGGGCEVVQSQLAEGSEVLTASIGAGVAPMDVDPAANDEGDSVRHEHGTDVAVSDPAILATSLAGGGNGAAAEGDPVAPDEGEAPDEHSGDSRGSLEKDAIEIGGSMAGAKAFSDSESGVFSDAIRDESSGREENGVGMVSIVGVVSEGDSKANLSEGEKRDSGQLKVAQALDSAEAPVVEGVGGGEGDDGVAVEKAGGDIAGVQQVLETGNSHECPRENLDKAAPIVPPCSSGAGGEAEKGGEGAVENGEAEQEHEPSLNGTAENTAASLSSLPSVAQDGALRPSTVGRVSSRISDDDHSALDVVNDEAGSSSISSSSISSSSSNSMKRDVPAAVVEEVAKEVPEVEEEEEEGSGPPLDWEALTREVEAVWVMEGESEAESDVFDPTGSPVVSTPISRAVSTPISSHSDASVGFPESPGDLSAAAKERPSSKGVVAGGGVAETSTGNGPFEQNEQDGGKQSGSAGVSDGPGDDVVVSGVVKASPSTKIGSHRRQVGGGSSSAFSVGSGFLEDSKEAAEDSDCASTTASALEEEDSILAAKSGESSHASGHTSSSGNTGNTGKNGVDTRGQGLPSLSSYPSLGQGVGERACSMDPTEDDDARSAASATVSPVVSVTPNSKPPSDAENIGDHGKTRGAGTPPVAVPAVASPKRASPTASPQRAPPTPRAPDVSLPEGEKSDRDRSKGDGGTPAEDVPVTASPQHELLIRDGHPKGEDPAWPPDGEFSRNEAVAPGGGGCAVSCGCVVM